MPLSPGIRLAKPTATGIKSLRETQGSRTEVQSLGFRRICWLPLQPPVLPEEIVQAYELADDAEDCAQRQDQKYPAKEKAGALWGKRERRMIA